MVAIFDPEKGAHLGNFPLPLGTTMVATNHDGTIVVVAEISVRESPMFLVDVHVGQVIAGPMTGHTDSLQSVRVSPNGDAGGLGFYRRQCASLGCAYRRACGTAAESPGLSHFGSGL